MLRGVHHREAGADVGRHRLPGHRGVGGHHAVVADLGRVLGDRHVDQPGLDVVDDALRRVERDHPDQAGLADRLDAVGRADRREQVGAEHAGEVRVAREHRLQLRGRLVGVVVVELGLEHLDLGEQLAHRELEALLALIGGRDAGLDVGDVDLALAVERLPSAAPAMKPPSTLSEAM